ncbi:MAG: mechanosensitive ion channel [Oscillospiraceae bacterium]|nr:mechanosensitive ion channel [Oscillospiraceae bacterium]
MDLGQILNFTVGTFTVGKILSALIIFIVGYIVIKYVMKLVERLVNRTKLEPTVKGLIKVVVKILLLFFLALIVADSLGINTTSFIAMFSVVGLAFSLAVENVLANVAGGLIIAVTKPFRDGDFVEIGTNKGTVDSISLFYTKLKTVDNKTVHIPNGSVSSSNIVNHSEKDTRMIDLTISASYDDPVQNVRKALLEAAEAVPGILNDPAPFVNVQEYGESSISYYFRVWVKNADYSNVRHPLMEEIKAAFDRNGVEMTYNHLNVHIVNGGE